MAYGEITTLALVKADLGITDTSDDTAIQAKVDAANDRINEYIGIWVGPSTDTVRLYDTPRGSRTSVGYRRLFIPGGFRSVSLLEGATATGGTFATFASSAYFNRPQPQPYWGAYTELWISDPASISANYAGFNTWRVTGVFGPAAVPPSLVEIATTLAKRMFKSRQTGSGDIVGTTAWGSAVFSRFLSKDDVDVLDRWAAIVGPPMTF